MLKKSSHSIRSTVAAGVVSLIGMLALTACVSTTEEAPERSLKSDLQAYVGDPGSVERGKTLFNTLCSACHGFSIAEIAVRERLFNENPQPPSIADMKAQGISYSEDYLKTTIMFGKDSVFRVHLMPAWGDALSDAEIADLVAFIRAETAQ